MSSGNYFPMLVKGVEIPKQNKGAGLCGEPAIIDRTVWMVAVLNLEPLGEPVFCDDSYGIAS